MMSCILCGVPAPGHTSADAINAIRDVARRTLPRGYDIAWEGLSFDEARRAVAATRYPPEGVRGIWCQLDSTPPPAPPPAATAAPSVAAAIGHIEWTFRLFDFEYHELGKDFRIAGDYAVNDGKLTTNHRDVGNFEILELTAAQMKLGRDQTSLQLQRGKCAPPAPK